MIELIDRKQLNFLSQEVLTQLEFEENALLSWGFLGGTFDAFQKITEVLETPATPCLEELWGKMKTTVQVSDILNNLVTRKLLFHSETEGFYTRYAETIRLLYKLKQRFDWTDWVDAPNLVGNIKSNLQYRKYPRRNRKWAWVDSELKRSGVNPFIKDVVYTLLRAKDGMLDLSDFQVNSLKRLLSQKGAKSDSATIIGAGTGAGKTKSFYLPAFGLIGESVREDDKKWTRVLGIYPRNELLKDQFREALKELLKLREFMLRNQIRPITIGCYYGDTPKSGYDSKHNDMRWDYQGIGYVCPYLTCLHCENSMLWLDKDYKIGVERLVCSDSSCDFELGPDLIKLSRRGMFTNPPDLLFTTTEMLNRKLSNTSDQHIFGIQAKHQPPFMVLLDEVHIYNGVSGAHIAYLIRRWRHLLRKHSPRAKVQFVGLSATLPKPKWFFSQLVGTGEESTEYVTPTEEQLVEEGIEYNLVVKGDPFSPSTLLSTTVQTAMLLGRVLDPLDQDVSNGAWGSKVFGFSEKLDVANRWHNIELDAELGKTLSRYRNPLHVPANEVAMQRRHGQVWDLANSIDPNSLDQGLPLDIVSSQHKGVDPNAKLVVATSSLEVGYNDEKVGAVVQHKSPFSLASFLQRKGRAGRTREMRPWTIIISSAYGRDRYAYEYPEHFFDPSQLPPLALPIRNTYIQRIQASFAVMDWLGYQLKDHGGVNVWHLLLPPNRFRLEAKGNMEKRNLILGKINDILKGNIQDLKGYLEGALQLRSVEVDRLLWTKPRSILLDLFPNLAARLQRICNGNGIKQHIHIPLQGFAPGNLFSSLEVNELQLDVPKQRNSAKKQEPIETMPLRQGISDFAPGNVSRRFGEALWIPLPEEETTIDLAKQRSMEIESLTEVEANGDKIHVFLPIRYKLTKLPNYLSDRSTGFLRWNVNMEPIGDKGSTTNEGTKIELLQNSWLDKILSNVETYTRDQHQYVRFTRYAREILAETKYKKSGSPRPKTFTFIDHQQQAAIGFQTEADALVFHLRNINLQNLMHHSDWEDIVKEMRIKFYSHSMRMLPDVQTKLSTFEINWLCDICIASVTAIAVGKQVSLKEAIQIYSNDVQRVSDRTLDAIFNTSLEMNMQGEADGLKGNLLKLIQNPEFMNHFVNGLRLLHADYRHEPTFWQWMQDRYASSVAAGLLMAMENVLPDVNSDEMIVDIEEDKIWFSEKDSGGLGIVTSIASFMRRQPATFEEHFFNAVNHCVRHEIAHSLESVVPHLTQNPLSETLKMVRNAKTLGKQKDALRVMQCQLSDQGIAPKRELVVSLFTKVIHANSSSESDKLIQMLHRFWQEEETRLNCKIPLNAFAVACNKRADLSARLKTLLGKVQPSASFSESQMYRVTESFLWSDCNDSCPDCLQLNSMFRPFVEPSRKLLSCLLQPDYEIVSYLAPNWREHVTKLLGGRRKVRLLVEQPSQLVECREKLFELLLEPIEIGYEMLYPFISEVQNFGEKWMFDLRIREVTHV